MPLQKSVTTINCDISDVKTEAQLYCICHKPGTDQMIACDNEECVGEWFHYECMKIDPNAIPKGKWYCPDCYNLPQFQKNKRKKL